MLNTAYRAVSRINRNLIVNPRNRKKIKNEDFTILANNCVGALILHDLNHQFLTPTVNLFLGTTDFVKFVENLDHYLEQDINEIHKEGFQYPIGMLGDLELHFVHYSTIEQAKEKWHERSKRINRDNIFIMMTDNDGCSKETIERFDNLPYENKVLLTKDNYEGYKSTFYIKGYENQRSMGDLTAYKNIFGKKMYDSFDYVSWLNRKL